MEAKLDFERSGPQDLRVVNWNSPDDKRRVAASLVMGVYILETLHNQKNGIIVAEPWWSYFHFKMIRRLVDNEDGSTYGAIYSYQPPFPFPRNAPRYVVAFRGTSLERTNLLQDMISDLSIWTQRFHLSRRSELAIRAVESVVFQNACNGVLELNVWIAGHSLGSAMAIQAGRSMAEKDVFLEAYLFNSPYPSALSEGLFGDNIKKALVEFDNLLTGVAATLFRDWNQRSKDVEGFGKLSKWMPNLFVNRNDPICSRYISYFEHSKDEGKVYSIRSLVKNAIFSKSNHDTFKPFYHLPSAHLVISNYSPSDYMEAHQLHQWWRVGPQQLQHKPHRWNHHQISAGE